MHLPVSCIYLGDASPNTCHRRHLLEVGSPVGELPERSGGSGGTGKPHTAAGRKQPRRMAILPTPPGPLADSGPRVVDCGEALRAPNSRRPCSAKPSAVAYRFEDAGADDIPATGRAQRAPGAVIACNSNARSRKVLSSNRITTTPNSSTVPRHPYGHQGATLFRNTTTLLPRSRLAAGELAPRSALIRA